MSEAEWYVLHRDLPRPFFDINDFIKKIQFLILILFAVFFLILFLLKAIASSSLFPDAAKKWMDSSPLQYCLLVWFVVSSVWFYISAKRITLMLIKLYQHYADESFRRKCKFKPTCSEYAELAIKKYGLLIGLYKLRKRLSKCHGNIYRIDYP